MSPGLLGLFCSVAIAFIALPAAAQSTSAPSPSATRSVKPQTHRVSGRPKPRGTKPWRPIIVVNPNQVLASPASAPTPPPANRIKTSGPDVFEHYDTGQ